MLRPDAGHRQPGRGLSTATYFVYIKNAPETPANVSGAFFVSRSVRPPRVISTRDFEFWGGFSIWCHLVIFKVIWCPTLKRENNSTSNEFLINLRFFVTFPLGSDFSIWKTKKEIGGIFRRDAGQNAPLLRHKTKGKSRMMNKFQARKFYRKMFANYPDVLTVEDATNLLGFKSQTGVIRRIHQNRIRYLKVGRNFMIPKEYLIDYLLSD